jgi:hypothetical protein
MIAAICVSDLTTRMVGQSSDDTVLAVWKKPGFAIIRRKVGQLDQTGIRQSLAQFPNRVSSDYSGRRVNDAAKGGL